MIRACCYMFETPLFTELSVLIQCGPSSFFIILGMPCRTKYRLNWYAHSLICWIWCYFNKMQVTGYLFPWSCWRGIWHHCLFVSWCLVLQAGFIWSLSNSLYTCSFLAKTENIFSPFLNCTLPCLCVLCRCISFFQRCAIVSMIETVANWFSKDCIKKFLLPDLISKS